jgi:ribosome-associated translation inhibitor RaiA
MQIDIHVRTDNPADLRSYIERRVNSVLSRFAGGLGAVTLRVRDVNGPQGSVDKLCEIRVQILPSGIFIMQETRDENLYASIDSAADRLGRSLSRYVELDQARRRVTARTHTGISKLRKNRTAA